MNKKEPALMTAIYLYDKQLADWLRKKAAEENRTVSAQVAWIIKQAAKKEAGEDTL